MSLNSEQNLPKLLYTKAEAAEILRLPVSGVSWLLRKGALPHRKIGKSIVFTLSDIEGLISACAVDCAAGKEGKK